MHAERQQRLDQAFIDVFRLTPDHADIEIQNGLVVRRKLLIRPCADSIVPEQIREQGIKIDPIFFVRPLREAPNCRWIIVIENPLKKALVDADVSRSRFAQ